MILHGRLTESQLHPLPQTDSSVKALPAGDQSAMQTLTRKLGKHPTVHRANESPCHCFLSLYHE